MLIGATLTALARSYHLFNGVSHLGLAGRWNFKSLKYFVFWLTVYAALAVIPVPSDRKGKSHSNPGGERRSLFCWSGLYPLWKGILFKWPFFEFPFGRYFVEYSRAHGSLSLYFNLSLRPIILTGRFYLFFSHAGKSFSICWLWPSSLYSNIFRLRFAKMAQKSSRRSILQLSLAVSGRAPSCWKAYSSPSPGLWPFSFFS